MDLTPRVPADLSAPAPFDRAFESWDAARASLLAAGYDTARVEGWKNSRVRPRPGSGGAWWSDVNPEAALLARQTVLASEDGRRHWEAVAAQVAAAGEDSRPPVHLMVAASGAACEDPATMARLMPELTTHVVAGSEHSIHRTAAVEFVRIVEEIVAGC